MWVLLLSVPVTSLTFECTKAFLAPQILTLYCSVDQDRDQCTWTTWLIAMIICKNSFKNYLKKASRGFVAKNPSIFMKSLNFLLSRYFINSLWEEILLISHFFTALLLLHPLTVLPACTMLIHSCERLRLWTVYTLLNLYCVHTLSPAVFPWLILSWRQHIHFRGAQYTMDGGETWALFLNY